jgi:hypothetical protein
MPVVVLRRLFYNFQHFNGNATTFVEVCRCARSFLRYTLVFSRVNVRWNLILLLLKARDGDDAGGKYTARSIVFVHSFVTVV